MSKTAPAMGLTHSDMERIRAAKAELARQAPAQPERPKTDEDDGVTLAKIEQILERPPEVQAAISHIADAMIEHQKAQQQFPPQQPSLPSMPPAKADVLPALATGREQLINSIVAATRELELIQHAMTFVANMTYACPTCSTLPPDRRPNPCPRCNNFGRVRASRIEAFFD